VPELLEKGRVRAQAEGLAVEFQAADAENLPFPDETFDVALSTVGVMFAPQHARAAREILRVLRSGGRIGLASWTPEGFIGQLFRVVGAHVPPPAGVRSPALWGTEPHMVELFGAQAEDIRTQRVNFNFRYRSAAHWIELFRKYYGPTYKAFAALDGAGQAALEEDLTALLERLNIGRVPGSGHHQALTAAGDRIHHALGPGWTDPARARRHRLAAPSPFPLPVLRGEGRAKGTRASGCHPGWGRAQWLVPLERVILLNTLYLPTGRRIGMRLTSSSVAASYTTSAPSISQTLTSP
jgi:SAM-dependent methyltransferase